MTDKMYKVLDDAGFVLDIVEARSANAAISKVGFETGLFVNELSAVMVTDEPIDWPEEVKVADVDYPEDLE